MHRALGAACLFALLVVPAAAALQNTEVTLTFDTPTSYRFEGEVTFTDTDATAYRNATDFSQDGAVTSDEVSLLEALLRRDIENATISDHRVDDAGPASVRVATIGASGLVGPTNASADVVLTFVVDYAFAVNASEHHVVRLARDPTGPNATFHVALTGPVGWAITNATGFDDPTANLTFAFDQDAGRSTLAGQPPASYGFTLVRAASGPWASTDGNGSIETGPGEGVDGPEDSNAAAPEDPGDGAGGSSEAGGERAGFPSPANDPNSAEFGGEDGPADAAGGDADRQTPLAPLPLVLGLLAVAAAKLQRGKQPPSC